MTDHDQWLRQMLDNNYDSVAWGEAVEQLVEMLVARGTTDKQDGNGLGIHDSELDAARRDLAAANARVERLTRVIAELRVRVDAAACPVCQGTGCDPMSDTGNNSLPCGECRGTRKVPPWKWTPASAEKPQPVADAEIEMALDKWVLDCMLTAAKVCHGKVDSSTDAELVKRADLLKLIARRVAEARAAGREGALREVLAWAEKPRHERPDEYVRGVHHLHHLLTGMLARPSGEAVKP